MIQILNDKNKSIFHDEMWWMTLGVSQPEDRCTMEDFKNKVWELYITFAWCHSDVP